MACCRPARKASRLVTNLSDLLPGPSDRACFVGQTGSGKTTLAEYVCRFRPYVVVYDAKGTIRWPGYKLVTKLERLQAAARQSSRIIYRPTYGELHDADIVDAFFEWVYRRKRTCIYVDELSAITRGDVYPWHLGACLTRGRELGVVVYASTQRPMKIPQVVLSESEHVYNFRLRLPQDRKRMHETTGIHPIRVSELAKQEFYYIPQDGDPEGPYRLQLPTV